MKHPSILSLLAAGVLATVATSSAHAVELQQKFQAGQSLNYDITMNGTANLKVPSDMPVVFAGVPLEIELNGKGTATLKTLEVNPAGDGTLLAQLPTFDLNGSSFGQKVLLQLRDGKPRFLFNGKEMGGVTPNQKKDEKANDKAYALIVSKDGSIKGVKTVGKDGKLLPTIAAQAATPQLKPIADEDNTKMAIDKGGLITSTILNALPTLWPKGDVKVGDTWKTELPLPAFMARTPEIAKTAPPLSKWTMTLKEPEVVDGASLWRVGIVGGIELDGKNLPAPAAPTNGQKAAPQLDNISQTVDGDLWFDADKGQIVRGEMVIDARGQGRTINAAGRKSDPSWVDFTGTLGLRLVP